MLIHEIRITRCENGWIVTLDSEPEVRTGSIESRYWIARTPRQIVASVRTVLKEEAADAAERGAGQPEFDFVAVKAEEAP